MRKLSRLFHESKGFTLIELLVVIVIVGILASFMVTNYVGVRGRARDTQRKSDLRQIQSALELYRSDNGRYPATITFGSSLTSGTVTYMQNIPLDPLNTSPYVYAYESAFGDSAYTIATCLENANDQQKDPGATPNIPTVSGGSSITGCDGTNNWSYTLYSP